MKLSFEALLAQQIAASDSGSAEFRVVASRHPRTRNVEFLIHPVGRVGPAGNFLVAGTIVTGLDRSAGG